MRDRFTKLEERVRALEAEAGQREYKGVWSDGAKYAKHNSVTYDGCVWICRADQARVRRSDGTDWQLAVKRGRDARPPR